MMHEKRIPGIFRGLAAATLLAAALFALDLIGGKTANAEEPADPPEEYTLTVNKQGGDSTCEIRLDQPETTAWTADSFQKTYEADTEYAPTQRVICPVFFRFSHWESEEDDDLDGWEEDSVPDFELTEDTTATAVFEPFCPGQVVIDMYNNPEILGDDGNEYPDPPGCQSLVTDLECYEDLLYENPGNFSYAELSCNHGSLPDEHPHWQWDNGVSDLFQDTRGSYGSAITVTSAYRCPRKNSDIGSKSTSTHPQGEAFDYDEISNQSNWDVAVAASNFADNERILLYGGGPTGYRSYKWLVDNGYDGSTLPSSFTNGYTHGHVDNS